jgi:hypothetical protein
MNYTRPHFEFFQLYSIVGSEDCIFLLNNLFLDNSYRIKINVVHYIPVIESGTDVFFTRTTLCRVEMFFF